MKQLMKTVSIKIALTVLAIFSYAVIAFSQDSGSVSSSTTTHTETTSVAIQPWMWIVGGAVLLIILVALLSGRNRGGVSVTKTTTVENSDV
jgi:hypothetical protein